MKPDREEIIRTRDYVSFVELLDAFPEFRGTESWTHHKHENVIFWSGLSREAVGVLSELMREKKITAIPTSALTYAMDGRVLLMPVAKGFYGYKYPHWFPVVFRLYTKE